MRFGFDLERLICEFDLNKDMDLYICEYCGKEFQDFPSRKRRFCSPSCNMKDRNRRNPELRFVAKTKKHFKITNECINYIDGILLSDACVKNPRTKSRWATRLTQAFSQRFREWAEQIKDNLAFFGIEARLTPYSVFDKRTNKTYHGISLQTKMYPEFMQFRKRWYPNNKKEVPTDIQLTPIVLTNWFLGDGSRPHGCIQLSTENFNDKSIDLLKQKLLDFGLDFHIGKTRRLMLYKENQTKRFLSLLGNQVPSCFDYKLGIGGD